MSSPEATDETALRSELAWHAAGELAALPTDGGGATLEIAGHRLALFRDGEVVRALADACPHMGASLGMGVALDGDVTCPWHGWHFRLADGKNTDGLEACVRTFPARVDEAGRIEVALPPCPAGA